MGCYVNPPGQDKDSWLEENGTKTDNPVWDGRPENTLPVCLVQNPLFSAAAVAYREGEFNHFRKRDPSDNRPKQWFYVAIEKLLKNSDLKHFL